MNRRLVVLFLVIVVSALIALAIYFLLDPTKDPTPHIARAQRLMEQAKSDRSKYKEAVPHLMGALGKGARGRADVWTMLAECYEQQLPPDLGEALPCRRAAMEAEPGNQTYMKNYVELLLKTVRVSEAINIARRLTDLDSSNDEYFRLVAQIEFVTALRETGPVGKTEHLDAAMAAVERAIELAPGNLENHGLKIGMLVTGVGIENIQDRLEQAEQAAVLATQQADEKGKAFLRLAQVYLQHAVLALRDGKDKLKDDLVAKAEKAYQDALAIKPDNAAALLGLGNIYLEQGNQGLAEEQFAKAIEVAPADDAGYYGMAQLRVRQNKPQEAIESLQKAAESGTPDGELIDDLSRLRRRKAILTILANMLIEHNKPEATAEAITHIDRLAKISTDNPAAIFYLRGRVAVQKGDLRAAEQKLLEAVTLSPNNAEYHHRLGLVYRDLGVMGKALEEFTQAVSRAPNVDFIRFERAQLLLRLRRYEEAETEARRVLTRQVKNLGAGVILTSALIGQKKYLEAGQMADQITKAAPDQPQGYLYKIEIMMVQNSPPAEALQVLLAGLDKVKSRHPLYQTAVLLCKRKNLQSEMADLFVRIDADKDLPDQQKQVLHDLKLTKEQLVEQTEKAVAADPENLQLLTRLAQLLVLDGKIDEALAVFRKAYDVAAAKDDEDMIRRIWDPVWQLLLSEDGRLQEAVDWIGKLPAGMTTERDMAEALIVLSNGISPPQSETQDKSDTEILKYRVDSIRGAIDKFRDLESRDPAGTDTRPMRALARSYFLLANLPGQERTKLLRDSESYYRKIIALQPLDMQSHTGLANVFLNLGDYAGVASQANEILKTDSENLAALDIKAMARQQLGRLDEAKAIRKQIRRLRPENVSNLLQLAALEELTRDFKEAEAGYREAIRLAPKNPGTSLALALLVYRQDYKNLSQADTIMADLEKDGPDSVSVLIAMSRYYKNTGRLDKALQYAEKARQAQPEASTSLAVFVSRAHLNVADAAGSDAKLRQEHLAKSVEVLQGYLKDHPEALGVKLELAEVLRMTPGRLADSEKLLRGIVDDPRAAARAKTILSRLLVARAEKDRKDGDDRRYSSLLDEAERMAKDALSAAPTFGEARLALAGTQMLRGDLAKAEMELKRIARTDPAYIRGLDLQIQIGLRQGRHQAIRLVLLEILKVQPRNVLASMRLADFYKADGDYDKAEKVIVEGLLYAPDNMQLTAYRGQLLLAQKTPQKVAQADQIAEALIVRTPHNPDAWAFWAGVKMTRSDVKPELKGQVTAKLEELAEQHKQPWGPTALGFHRLLISHYNHTKVAMLAEAKTLLDQLLAEHKKGLEGPLLFLDLSRALQRSTPGQVGFEQAAGALRDGLELHPKSILLLHHLVMVYTTQTKWDEAIKMCDRILAINDKFVPVVILKSNCLLNLERFDEAISWAKAAVKLDQTQWQAMNNIAWVYATKKDDLAQARAWIDRALRLKPAHPSLLDTSGWIYYLSGDWREAIREITRSLKNASLQGAPKSLLGTFHLGMAYRLKAEKETDPGERIKAQAQAGKFLKEFLKESQDTPRLAPQRKQAENVLKDL